MTTSDHYRKITRKPEKIRQIILEYKRVNESIQAAAFTSQHLGRLNDAYSNYILKRTSIQTLIHYSQGSIAKWKW